MKKFIGSAAALAALALVAACSGGATKENPRTAKFKEIAKASKLVEDELKKDAPSAEVLASNAAALDALAKDLPNWFPGTTGPEADITTEARPEIWQNPEGFKEIAGKFAASTEALRTASEAGDVTQVQAAFGEVRPNCKGCHDQFRAKK